MTEPAPRPARWDVFCRVVDNHGDAGVCWRLCCDLASRGLAVRLWIDDARALSWMAPAGHPSVDVRGWPDDVDDAVAGALGQDAPADVVVETFGCGLPSSVLTGLASADEQGVPAVWINLEYLSAEAYVERSHTLPSLQMSGAGRGLTAWFFYPGFTPGTGGLLRESGLREYRDRFDRSAWLRDQGIDWRPDERVVSLFCYENPRLPALLEALDAQPTLLLTTPGAATDQVRALSSVRPPGSALRVQTLPWISQTDYDHLLWSCDLNFVRGEDSLVRAIWSARPFVWQIYQQHDGAHGQKLSAFLERVLDDSSGALPVGASNAMRAWNGLLTTSDATPTAAAAWAILNDRIGMEAWRARCSEVADRLSETDDLGTQLIAFARTRRAKLGG